MYLSDRFISASEKMCEYDVFVPAPYFRKNVIIDKNAEKAEMSVCGLGFYRFFLDGEELTRGFLSPYISNSDDVADYDVYDLTDRLTEGRHVLAFTLGNGMQNAFGGYVWDFEKAAFRSAPKLAFCLEITGKDGKTLRIEADESVKTFPSPLLCDDLRYGEYYDANAEVAGWNTVDFDDSGWKPSVAVPSPKGKKQVCAANPIVVTEERKPVIIGEKTVKMKLAKEPFSGILYDFGLSTAGIPRLKIDGKKGQKIEMYFGDCCINGEFQLDNISFPRDEYRDMPLYVQKDTYICKGEKGETWEPSFTYHGFRYVLVCGLEPEQIREDLLTYKVMNTSLPVRGGFSCSDEVLNRLQRMTEVADLANFWHFPTDCPHREKNGWTGDANFSAEQMTLLFETDNNYTEWMKHICASMDEKGAIPGIVPTGGWGFNWGNGPAWDKVLTELPYVIYRYRGKKEIVENTLPYLLKYVKYLSSRMDEKGLVAIGLGDWVAPKGVRVPLVFTDSVLSMDICRTAAFLMRECGRDADADYCQGVADGLMKAVRDNLIDHERCTAISCFENDPWRGCQSSQAMGLYYGVFTDEEKNRAFTVLLDRLREENDHLDTGVLGLRVLFRVLSDFGYTDYALRIVTDPAAPSYGEWVARGETALCEDFNGFDALGKAEVAANSLCHHFMGDISAWMISELGGIRYNPYGNDINKAVIAPKFARSLTHAEAFHICPKGRIDVKWVRKGRTVVCSISVPEGMHGEIRADLNTHCGGKTVLPLRSGEYIFKEC